MKNWEGKTLDLGKEMSLTKIGAFKDMNYRQQGRFDYIIGLKPNTVYGLTSMSSRELPRSSYPIPPEVPIAFRTLGWLDIKYSYKYKSDKPVQNLKRQVEIIASLEDAKQKELELITLLPYTDKDGDFDITIPLDLRKFKTAILPAGEKEAATAVAPKLNIKANVHVSFEPGSGIKPVDEVFSQIWTATLTGSDLTWGKELAVTKRNTVKQSKVTSYPDIARMRKITLPLAVVFLLGLIYLLFNLVYLIYPRIRAGRGKPELKVLKVQKKRKDIIVDITELPQLKDGDILIKVDSLDDLIKASDSFMKPVLRRLPANDMEPYYYYVLDGSTRYEYMLSRNSDSAVNVEQENTA